MFQALTGALMGSPKSTHGSPGPATSPSKVATNVNMMPRGNKTKVANRSNSRSSDLPDDLKSMNRLMNEITVKDSMIASLQAKVLRLEDEMTRKPNGTTQMDDTTSIASSTSNNPNTIAKRKHPISSVQHIIHEDSREQATMGTRGSISTMTILEEIPEETKSDVDLLAEKFILVFQSPVDYIRYLTSAVFANDLIKVCQEVSMIFEDEPKCLFMQSPVYVLGDIHGNVEDLHFFADNLWKLGMDLTAGQFLFLGDYVDRGPNGLECLAYLFGLKILYPNKIHMLRGNHETRDVNGWEDHYADKSFLFQCKERFGADLGTTVWEECNLAFDRLPVAAVIDHEIFCVHGGIPRPVKERGSEIEAILAMPPVLGIMPTYEDEPSWARQVASDCIWSDPAPESMEKRLGPDGFGTSQRGGDAVMFGAKAIDNFLLSSNLSYIIRAHEAHAHGVALSKGARVFTVFSTSKDHRQGSRAMAGCILVDVEKIKVINRSPKYGNKYVHRRTSVALQALSDEEIEERRRLGFVRSSNVDEEYTRIQGERELEKKKKKELIARINNVDVHINEGDMEDVDEMGEPIDDNSIATHRPTFG